MKKVFVISTFLLLSLFGCRVGPRYHSPCTEVPLQWKTPQVEEDIEVEVEPIPAICNWWEIFHDADLNNLEEQAVENNPNLYVAMARINEAWALAGVSLADLFPQFNLNPSYSNTGMLFKIFLPSTFANIFPGVTIPSIKPFRIHQLLYSIPLNMNYELDLWGKYRSQYDSDIRNAQAKEEAYYTALLSLTSDLASSYFNLRFLDTLIDIYKDTIGLRQKFYELAQSRFKTGLTNYSDVLSAHLELSNTESQYEDALRQRGLQENMIAAFIGVPASEFTLPHMPLDSTPPNVPAGIPSTILQRRPDIAEAERNMASEHAIVGVAYASFFPSFELTGTLGFSSPTFRDFLTWKSRLWSIGTNVAQTVFDAGRKKSNLEIAWARFDEANGNYQQTVLTAFKEVEDSLTNLEYEKKQSDSLQNSVSDATRLTRISISRYQQGLANYIEVVTNERSQLDAQRSYINVLGQRYQSTIQLIKALGGGY